MLIPTPFNPVPNQERKIMRAYYKKKGCRIKAKKMGSKAVCKSGTSFSASATICYEGEGKESRLE